METNKEECIKRISEMFGRIKGMIGWRRLLKDYLVVKPEDFPLQSKVEAIENALSFNSNNDSSVCHILQILIENHKEFSIANRIRLNNYLDPLGLSMNEKGFIETIIPRDSFKGAIRSIFLAIQKSKFVTMTILHFNKTASLPSYKYHLTQSYKHFLGRNWDDMSSQLRKVLELSITDSSKWVEFEKSERYKNKKELIKKKQNKPSISERLKYLKHSNYITDKEELLIYSVYQFLSEKGAHPGIPSEEEGLIKRRIALDVINFFIKKFL